MAQIKVNEKSNEIAAIPELPDMLDSEGCTISIDAMGGRKILHPELSLRKQITFWQTKIISRLFDRTLFGHLSIVPQMMSLRILMQAMAVWKQDAPEYTGIPPISVDSGPTQELSFAWIQPDMIKQKINTPFRKQGSISRVSPM